MGNEKECKATFGWIFASAVTVAFFVAVLVIAWEMKQNPVVALFLPLMVLFWLISLGWSNNRNLNKGEMRRAIAASLVTAFMVLVFSSVFGLELLIVVDKEILNFFFGVLSMVIGFYFGYRTGEERIKSPEGTDQNK